MRKLLLGLCLVLASCGTKTVGKSVLNCQMIEGFNVLLSEDGPQMIVFGEVHGTKEVPEFVGNAVCLSLQKGYPTILAIEHPTDMATDYANFLAPSENAEQSLLATRIWSKKGQYGVTSQAMFQLVKQTKAFKLAGYETKIIPFDLSETQQKPLRELSFEGYSAKRDELMAANLMQIMNENVGTKIIVLTGNLHSNQGLREKGDLPYPFMANYLPKNKITSLFANSQPGAAWASINGKSGVHELWQRAANPFKTGGMPSQKQAIHMYDTVENGHNGLFYTVTMTPSVPMVESAVSK